MQRWTFGPFAILVALVPLAWIGANALRAQSDTEPASAQESPAPEAGASPVEKGAGQVAAAPARPPGLGLRIFNLRYRKVDDAYLVVSPHLGPRGSVRMQPAQRTLVVQDLPENIKTIAALIASFDVPPRGVEVSVQLIMASAGTGLKELPPPPIRGVIDRLSALNTRWTDYKMVGNARLRGTEGERSSLRVGDEYRVEFRIDQVSDENRVIRFKPFELSRREMVIEGQERYTPIMNTVLNLRDSQLFIVGASKAEQSNRALFMTITAALETRQ